MKKIRYLNKIKISIITIMIIIQGISFENLYSADLPEKVNTIEEADKPGDENLIDDRLDADRKNRLAPFTLMAHNPNYLLVAAHNFSGWNSTEYEKAYGVEDIDLDNTETQFQLSIKTPLAIDLFESKIDLYAAYTVRSFWQFYNRDLSTPFRETNHSVETWIQSRSERKVLGFKNSVNGLGLIHQSNGQGEPLSRSWNRVYAGFAFERGGLALLFRPWVRIKENAEEDDNRDIIDYMGHGEIRIAYKYNEHVFSLMTRNLAESGFKRGAVETGWSFPLFGYKYLKGYIQYFNGYGESLIDYNSRDNRIGIGFLLTDIL